MLQSALGPAFKVESAGLDALVGQPAHATAQSISSRQGLDLSAHLGRQLTPEMALEADLILVMSQSQLADCVRLVPSLKGRVFLLGHWLPPGDREIADPFRQSDRAHEEAMEHIRSAIQPWLARLNPRKP